MQFANDFTGHLIEFRLCYFSLNGIQVDKKQAKPLHQNSDLQNKYYFLQL